jgi:hypothetical protein
VSPLFSDRFNRRLTFLSSSPSRGTSPESSPTAGRPHPLWNAAVILDSATSPPTGSLVHPLSPTPCPVGRPRFSGALAASPATHSRSWHRWWPRHGWHTTCGDRSRYAPTGATGTGCTGCLRPGATPWHTGPLGLVVCHVPQAAGPTTQACGLEYVQHYSSLNLFQNSFFYFDF